jgi:hypothetical protein
MDGQPWQIVTPKVRIRDVLAFVLVGAYLGVVFVFLVITRRLTLQWDWGRKLLRLPRRVAQRVVRVFKPGPANSEKREAA